MRTIVALAMIALLVTPVMAHAKGRRDQSAAVKPDDSAKRKADAAAYERALKSIPEPKVKIDPWSGAR